MISLCQISQMKFEACVDQDLFICGVLECQGHLMLLVEFCVKTWKICAVTEHYYSTDKKQCTRTTGCVCERS